ncbi:MAG: LysR family transcriptional regulator [Comamonas sp.]|nr:LysR family transcriptional regulator [Candidatus Comamonas equi]
MVKRVLPPLKALRAFEAAARHTSFTAAAEELHITHSAVSQQVRILEEYLGQPLFAREARGVQLLPHAQTYFQEIQTCLDRIGMATSAFKSPQTKNVLRVCTTPSLAMKWLIPRLSSFQARVPDAEVQLSTLGRGQIERADLHNDVVIHHLPLQRPNVVCVRCLQDYLIPVASPRYIHNNRIYKHADCLGHPLLQVRGHVNAWSQWFELAGVQVPTELPGPVFDHHFLSLQAAMNDLGLAMAPWCLLQEDVHADRLRPLFGHPRLNDYGLYATYRADGPALPLAKQFVSWLGDQDESAHGMAPAHFPPSSRR